MHEKYMEKLMEEYLNNAIESFNDDPADSKYQEGYYAALIEVREELKRQESN